MPFGFGRKNTADATIRVNYKGKEAENGLNSLKKTILAVITVAAIKQLAQYTFELGKLGAQAQSVQKNFENFANRAGRNAEEMTIKLRKATLGMVNDMELQQRAMQAMVSGVKFDDIITAMEFVTKFAQATGTDVSQKMMTTMTGLARGSAQFLDDIGIQVIGSKDVVNDAIAQMKEKMDQFTTSEDDAAVKAEQLNARLKNLKIEVGEHLQPVFLSMIETGEEFVNMLNFITGGVDKVIDKINQEALVQNVLNGVIEKESELRTKLDEERKITLLTFEDFFKRENFFLTEFRVSKTKELGIEEQLNEVIKKRQALEINLKRIRGEGTPDDLKQQQVEQRRRRIEEKQAIEEMQKKAQESAEKRQKELDKQAKKDEKRRIEQNQKASEWLDEQTTDLEEHEDLSNAITLEQWEERIFIQKKAQRIALGDSDVWYLEQFALLEHWGKMYPDKSEEIEIIRNNLVQQRRDEDLEAIKKAEREKTKTAEEGLSAIATINNAIISMIDSRTSMEIAELERLNISQEEFEEKRTKIKEEAAEKQRAFARIQQVIAVAEAWINVYKAATGVFSETFGGVITRSLAMGAAIFEGAATVGLIEAQRLQTGEVGIGGVQRSRQKDNMFALVGQGESVIGAPQTAQHKDTLEAINNNTANTARGIGRMSQGQTVNNFFGISTDQLLEIQVQQKRRQLVGRRL